MRNTLYYIISKLLIASAVTALCCCSYRLPKRSPQSIEQAQKWYAKASATEWRRVGRQAQRQHCRKQ